MKEDTLAEGLGDRQAQMSERLSRGPPYPAYPGG